MEEEKMMELIPQARLVKQNDKIGVSCPDVTIWCKDDFQAALLHAVAEAPQSVDDLEMLLMHMQDGPVRVEFAALMLADFILTFGDAIKN